MSSEVGHDKVIGNETVPVAFESLNIDPDPVAAAVSILKAAGLVRKDWSEDAHPRDEHGKFIEGGEAVDPSQLQVGQTVTMTDGSSGPKITGVVSVAGPGGIKIIDAKGISHYGFTNEGAKVVLHGAHEETAKPTTGAKLNVGDKITITHEGHLHEGQQAVITGDHSSGLGHTAELANGDKTFIGHATDVTLHEPAGAAAPPVEGPVPGGTGMVTPAAGEDPFRSFGAGKGVGELPKTQSGIKASSASSREAVKDHYSGKVGIERVAHIDDKRTAVELKDGRVLIYRNEGAKGVYASLGSKSDMPKPQGVGKLPESQSKIQASSAAGRQALKDYYANPGAHTLEHTSDTTSRITLSDGRVLDLRNENGKIYAKLDKATLPGTGKPGAAEESKPVGVFSGLGHESAGSLPIGTPVTTLNGQQGIIADHQTGNMKTYVLLTNGSTIGTSSSVAMEHGPLGTGKTQMGFDPPPDQQPAVGQSSTPAPVVDPHTSEGFHPIGQLPVGTPVSLSSGMKGTVDSHGTGSQAGYTYIKNENGNIQKITSVSDVSHGKLGAGPIAPGYGPVSPSVASLQETLNQTAAQMGKVPEGYKLVNGVQVPKVPASSKPGAGPIPAQPKLYGTEASNAVNAGTIISNQPLGYASSVVTFSSGKSYVYTQMNTPKGAFKVSTFDPKMVPKPSSGPSFGGAGAQSYASHDAAAHAAELYPGFASPTSNSEGVQWANQHFGSTPQATGAELAKLKSYTGSLAHSLNEQLRSGGNPSSAKTIDSALAKNRAPADVVLHRGEPFSKYFTQSKLDNPQALKGSVVRDPGYKSSSTGSNSAYYTSTVQLHMAVPKGTPAAYVQNISHYTNEREVLLGRNLPMRVDDVVHAGNQYHVYLTVLQP